MKKTISYYFQLLLIIAAACGSEDPAPGDPEDETGTLAAVVIDQGSLVLSPWWDNATLTAHGEDEDGQEVADLLFTWASDDATIAEIGQDGKITSHKPGSVQIRVSSGEFEDALIIEVKQLNEGCTPPEAEAVPPAANASFPVLTAQIATSSNGDYDRTDGVALDINDDGVDEVILFVEKYDEANQTIVSSIQVLRYDGGNTFTDIAADVFEGAIPTPQTPRDIVVADLDGDGRRDLFVAQHGYDVGCGAIPCPGAPDFLLLNTVPGKLVYASENAFSPYSTHSFTHSNAAADVDCDGDTDLFEGNWPNDNAPAVSALFINDGGGTFTRQNSQLPSGFSLTEAVPAAEFADLDNDGDPELIAARSQDRIRILINDGAGTFRLAPKEVLPVSPYDGDANSEADEIKAADINADGWVDLVVSFTERTATTYAENTTLRIYLNNHDMTFTDVTETALAEWSWDGEGFIKDIYVQDFNGDGWRDILAANLPLGQTRLFINRGDNTFAGEVLDAATVAGYPYDMRGVFITPVILSPGAKPGLLIVRGIYDHYVVTNN